MPRPCFIEACFESVSQHLEVVTVKDCLRPSVFVHHVFWDYAGELLLHFGRDLCDVRPQTAKDIPGTWAYDCWFGERGDSARVNTCHALARTTVQQSPSSAQDGTSIDNRRNFFRSSPIKSLSGVLGT